MHIYNQCKNIISKWNHNGFLVDASEIDSDQNNKSGLS